MAEPWIRVHADLAGKPVVRRAMDDLHISRAEAIGYLVQFWSAVSRHVPGGHVAGFSDGQLEDWAGWTKKRGAFATWVRSQHLDANGCVNEWDDYQGALEDRREKDRARQKRHRDKRDAVTDVTRDVTPEERDGHTASASAVTRDKTVTSGDTIRNDTKREEETSTAARAATRVKPTLLAPDEFERAWAAYPRRAGGNPRRDAELAWSARVRAGDEPDAMIHGVERYRAYVASQDQLNTQFVMQAKRFFGPSKLFLESWDSPADAQAEDPAAKQQREVDESEIWLAGRYLEQANAKGDAAEAGRITTWIAERRAALNGHGGTP